MNKWRVAAAAIGAGMVTIGGLAVSVTEVTAAPTISVSLTTSQVVSGINTGFCTTSYGTANKTSQLLTDAKTKLGCAP